MPCMDCFASLTWHDPQYSNLKSSLQRRDSGNDISTKTYKSKICKTY